VRAPAIALLAVASAAAQTPDLQGVYVNNDATPLERPKALEGRAFLTDAEVAELRKRADRIFKGPGSDFTNGDNYFLAVLADVEHYHNPAGQSTGSSENMIDFVIDNRTSLVVDPPDGKIPPLTPEGRRRKALADAAGQRSPTSWEDTTNSNRCITLGVPRLGGNFGAGIYSYYQIFQTSGYVVFFMEGIHEARIIPLDGRPHIPPSIRQWGGDSRGHWEGKTLVADTTNFSPKSKFMGSAENLHLVERFTRIAPDKLKYDITVDDPTTWAKPWTASLRLTQTKLAIYEFACHEGNYEVMHALLGAARADETKESK
jgi:hypothetical protein